MASSAIMKKTTMYLDEAELDEAKAELGASSDAEAVRMAIQAVLRMAAYQRMKTFAGTEKGLVADVPRRRSAPSGTQANHGEPAASVRRVAHKERQRGKRSA